MCVSRDRCKCLFERCMTLALLSRWVSKPWVRSNNLLVACTCISPHWASVCKRSMAETGLGSARAQLDSALASSFGSNRLSSTRLSPARLARSGSSRCSARLEPEKSAKLGSSQSLTQWREFAHNLVFSGRKPRYLSQQGCTHEPKSINFRISAEYFKLRKTCWILRNSARSNF